MKKQVIFVHGGTAFSTNESFLEYLRTVPIQRVIGIKGTRWPDTLKDADLEWEVFTPQMPNAQNAKYQEWKVWFERHFEVLHDGVVLIGWSLGGYFLAKYLTENVLPVKIRALYLVASPFESLNDGREDGGDFNFDTEQLSNLAKQVPHIVLYHSKDDFVVPYGHALKYKEKLPQALLVLFEDRVHFWQEEFPELIKEIKELG